MTFSTYLYILEMIIYIVMNKNICCRGVAIILFFSITICNFNVNAFSENGDSDEFFGFLIPDLDYEDDEFENLVYRNMMNLINDLLRENITVYWVTSNISMNVFNLFDNNSQIMEFREGSFIVPFSGNEENDYKLTNIIYDYNYTFEIDSIIDIQIPVFLILEQKNLDCYCLNEVKIIGYRNYLTCTEDWYQQVAFLCGFLDFDVFDNDIFSDKIDNSDYNLIIFPAYDLCFPSYFAFTEIILDILSKRTNAIRSFVRNGGGYVGSCYGQYMASAGIFPVYQRRKALNPELGNYGFLALQDTITVNGEYVRILEQVVVDDSHPVTTNLGDYIYGGYGSYPKVTHAGDTVDVLLKFINSSSLDGCPSIVSNDFGKGKVVSFGPHPEASDYDTTPLNWDKYIRTNHSGKRMVVNSFLYTTSKNDNLEMDYSYNQSIISNVINTNKNLTYLLDNSGDYFKIQISELYNLTNDIYELYDFFNTTLHKIKNIAKDENIDIVGNGSFLGYGVIKYGIHELELILTHLKNSINNLLMFDKVVFLNKNDDEFMDEIKDFKENLTKNIDILNDMNSETNSSLLKFNKMADKYNKSKLHKIYCNKISSFKAMNVENSYTYENIFLISNISSKILKELRSAWYLFELANI